MAGGLKDRAERQLGSRAAQIEAALGNTRKRAKDTQDGIDREKEEQRKRAQFQQDT